MEREKILHIAKPILFNTDMVSAILDDRKTKTRRKVEFLNGKNPNWTGYVRDGLMLYNGTNEPCIKPPRYKVGEYLYVRETWKPAEAKIFHCQTPPPRVPEIAYGYEYKADNGYFWKDGFSIDDVYRVDISSYRQWRPSIHMPKEAARIFLRVTDVMVERLHDMTLDDFLAEGVVIRPEAFNDPENAYWQAREIFSSIWDSTIPKKDLGKYGFDANPWEWAYGFERVEV